ncbi:MAG: MerR family transcriptional regulator [Coriobacteriia bacterium]|nr:MerR family transcriptional regulator [Coriobacteriia bacterium]
MKDLYTIQEFSKISGIDASVLRYWDDIGVFSPIRRNLDNNYRYYSVAQLFALNFVATMSDLGIPLKTIAELKESRDPESILAILEKRERELDDELRKLNQRTSIIHARQDMIRSGLKADDAEVAVRHLDTMALILWPRNEYQEGETFINPLTEYVNQSNDLHVNLSFPVGGYWDSYEAFSREPSCPEHFVSVSSIGSHIVVEGMYLTGYARGYYGDMGDLPERMTAYAEQNSIQIHGPTYTLYLLEETSTIDPSQYLAQTFVAVK